MLKLLSPDPTRRVKAWKGEHITCEGGCEVGMLLSNIYHGQPFSTIKIALVDGRYSQEEFFAKLDGDANYCKVTKVGERPSIASRDGTCRVKFGSPPIIQCVGRWLKLSFMTRRTLLHFADDTWR